MLVCVFIEPTYPTSDVTTFADSAVYILYIFANNFGTKRDIVYYSKWPISLLFHALSHKTIKFYCQCPLKKTKLENQVVDPFIGEKIV